MNESRREYTFGEGMCVSLFDDWLLILSGEKKSVEENYGGKENWMKHGKMEMKNVILAWMEGRKLFIEFFR
jgi:hypothetical protein